MAKKAILRSVYWGSGARVYWIPTFAVRAGLDRNYKLMEKIFTDVILRSLKPFEKK